MTSFLSTVTDRLPSMETVSSYIPSNEDVTAGFGKVQDSASKAWENISETFSESSYKAISDNVAPLRRTEEVEARTPEEVEARTPEEVNVRDEAFDLHTSRRKFCRLGEAEVRLTGRIKRAAKRGDVQAQLKLKANRTLIRHKMKTLKKTINRMGFSAGPIDPEVYRNMDEATHQDLFRGGVGYSF